MSLLPNFAVKSQNLIQQVRMGYCTLYFGVITCFKDIYYDNTTVFFEEPCYTKLTLLKSNE